MFINISSDRIFFINQGERTELPYGELEKHLPDFLYNRFAEATAKGGKLVVLNGPGSFTNLRIATLALNTFNTLHEFKLDFVSIDKIQWYKKLYEVGRVKRYCVMYIGQKKNYRFVDLQNPDSKEKVHVDYIKKHISGLSKDRFVDELVAEGKELLDELLGTYDMYVFDEKDLGDVVGEETKLLEANYMIDANIS